MPRVPVESPAALCRKRAAFHISVSDRQLDKLAKAGVFPRVILPGMTKPLFRVVDLDAALERNLDLPPQGLLEEPGTSSETERA